jgi:hypothetical protein
MSHRSTLPPGRSHRQRLVHPLPPRLPPAPLMFALPPLPSLRSHPVRTYQRLVSPKSSHSRSAAVNAIARTTAFSTISTQRAGRALFTRTARRAAASPIAARRVRLMSQSRRAMATSLAPVLVLVLGAHLKFVTNGRLFYVLNKLIV